MSDIKPTSIRLSNEMLKRIQEDAAKDMRSVSKQIEYMLLQYYEMKRMLND